MSFTGPEPVCTIPERAARRAVIDWMNRKHRNTGSPHLDKIM
jgi:hypothetical protein